jgi:hypothetical protein
MRIDELRRTLSDEAQEVGEGDGVHARNAAVMRRVQAKRGRRWAGTAAALTVAAVAVVAGLVVIPPMLPDGSPAPTVPDDSMVQTPPRLAGWAMPDKVQVRSVAYRYLRGEQTRDDRSLLRVAVASNTRRQVIGWSTAPGMAGQVVVSIDGDEVSRSTAGAFEYGALLMPDRPHLVVVRVTDPRRGTRIGLAVFELDRFR